MVKFLVPFSIYLYYVLLFHLSEEGSMNVCIYAHRLISFRLFMGAIIYWFLLLSLIFSVEHLTRDWTAK